MEQKMSNEVKPISDGFLLIFSGPSGSGKDTVINEIVKRDEKTIVSISMTTRKPRPNEVDGVNYYFVTKEEFLEKINNDEMLEWAQYGDNYYGTPKAPVFKWISEGKTVILEIEVQGTDKIKAKYPNVRTMFLMPPSIHVLRERLSGRNTETEEEVNKRIEIAKKEIGRANDYDYIIVNNRLEDAIDDALEIILRHRRHLRCSLNNEPDKLEEFYYGHQFKNNFSNILNERGK
ncbi:MAG: guanylate kinase [Oscillospiraceae bacterium]|nr:guanylate kinase [Oscillospiraceae bacterium]